MKIGPHEFKFPLMLAPMAGYSDKPFREIVREWGADYAVADDSEPRGPSLPSQKLDTLGGAG